MRIFRLVASVVFLVAPAAVFAADPEPPWLEGVDATFAAARAEQKPVLLYVRRNCQQRCNERIDAMFAELGRQPLIAHSMQAIAVGRVDEQSATGVAVDLVRRFRPPFVTLLDASGEELVTQKSDYVTPQWLTVQMQALRDVRPMLKRASDYRVAGETASADYVFGHAMLRMKMPRLAAARLQKAADGFRAKGDLATAQYAAIDAGFAYYAAKQKMRGLRLIADMMQNPANATVEAQGWYRRGGIGQLDRRRGKAIEAFRRAYQIAPTDSEVFASARNALQEIDDQPLPQREGLASRPAIRLIPPARRTITGHAEFVAIADAATRVDFFLDGAPAAQLDKPPFRAKLDVGRTPRIRMIRAVAYDGAGRALGEAVVAINDRADAFRVAILSPVEAKVEGRADVELDATAPPGRSVARIDLYWKDARVGALERAPFRTQVAMNGEFGYLRAVATLDDGTTAEETRLFNVENTEVVDVAAVTFVATVLDDQGTPILGLGPGDIAVREEERPVEINVRGDVEEPVTIGIAIDSSSSMSRNLAFILQAAADVVEKTVRPQDRAFVASFDTSARIAQAPTNDIAALRSSIFDLRALGATSIYDGITFALQQFQDVDGKRVLVVVSDGQENSSMGNADECIRLARTVGVPIYAIIPRAQRLVRNPLASLAEMTGGRSFRVNDPTDIPPILARMADEIRGQYVLSFQSPDDLAPGEWRRLSVAAKGMKVRTIAGYYTR